ncbi:helix-turn-helix domain-containing protein [Streptomyces sp. NBC_01497]|uniref:helix-turn-helix domain-containing protein n=1 Tax=Streptomyces sp. NBC_01497 TaxID=2903885 RepID=UPI002E33E1DC|nr:helix-turn-helix domain-containing protein [Streptomyces sp. NBC_01497]
MPERDVRTHVVAAGTRRRRFAVGRVPALADRERSGRPPTSTAPQTAEVKALACQLPTESGAPLSRWSCPELAREAVTRTIADTISVSTVRRRPEDDALKPWRHRSWIFISDPEVTCSARSSRPGTSPTSPRVGDRLRAFEDRYDAAAQPLPWKFTTSDLDSAGRTRPAHRRSPGRILRRTGSLINPRRTYDADH